MQQHVQVAERTHISQHNDVQCVSYADYIFHAGSIQTGDDLGVLKRLDKYDLFLAALVQRRGDRC